MLGKHGFDMARLLGLAILTVPFLLHGTAARAAATDLVVLEAKGLSLSPGQRIDGSQPLQLEAGDQIKLIANNGRLIRLSGPYNDVPLAAGGGGDSGRLSQSLAALVGGGGTTSAMLGAHRAVPELGGGGEAGLSGGNTSGVAAVRTVGKPEIDLPEPWILDVNGDGNRCLHGTSQPVILWRQARDEAQPVEVSVADGAWRGRTEWPRGYTKLATPEALPRLDGERYTVEIGSDSVSLTLHVIPETIDEPAVLAAWMMEKGCRSQAAALLRTADSSSP